MNITKKIYNLSNMTYWFLINDKKNTLPNYSVKSIFIPSLIKKEKTIHIEVYKPPKTKPQKSCIFALGLHPNAKGDIRIIKYAAAMAQSGYLVYVPYIEDYSKLHIKEDTHKDFIAAFDHLVNVSTGFKNPKPSIFSISFGSFLTLKVANDEKLKHHVNKIILFGGYLDWFSTCSSIIKGDNSQKDKFDIRVTPLIFNHIIDDVFYECNKEDKKRIQSYFIDYIKETWKDQNPADPSKLLQLSKKYTQHIHTSQKERFLQCLNLQKGTWELFKKHSNKPQLCYLNPLSKNEYSNITCPTYIMHSADDTIISTKQYNILKESLPNIKHHFLTSYYDHTQKKPGTVFTLMSQHLKDLKNFIVLFWDIA